MNSKPEISVEPILKSLEEEISNTVRGETPTERLAWLKPQPEVVGDVNHSIGKLIDKVSATSIAEIEKLISDLQAARNYLKAEGDRIQQEMARYAHLSDTASSSVKIIAEKLGQLRGGPTMIKTDNVRLDARRGNSHALSSLETVAENVTSSCSARFWARRSRPSACTSDLNSRALAATRVHLRLLRTRPRGVLEQDV